MDEHDGIGTDPAGYDGGGPHGSRDDSYDLTGGDSDDGDEGGGDSDDGDGDEGGAGGPGDRGASGTMTVEVDGQTRELRVERDYTGDGLPDAAAETADGKVIIFADTEDNATGEAGPDGKADEVYVVDKQTGKVVGAAHVDPRTGEWVDAADTDGSPPAGSGAGTTGSRS